MKLRAVLYALQHDHWNKPSYSTTKTKHRKKLMFDHTFCRHSKPHPKQVSMVQKEDESIVHIFHYLHKTGRHR